MLSRNDWFAWPTMAAFISFCVADTDRSFTKSATADAPFAAAPPAPATFLFNLSLWSFVFGSGQRVSSIKPSKPPSLSKFLVRFPAI